jgi:RNA polymerase sigma-70 factor (ECF subfamily)
MSRAPTFEELIRQVRAGDQDAAATVVQLYEPAIRRAVRYRLADARLGTLLDSMDICQSVLASFFVRAAAGQYNLDTPEQLLKLLVSMARNKLALMARRQRAQRRDYRRTARVGVDAAGVAAGGGTPSQRVAARELLQEVRRRLTPEELQVMELRQQGHDWPAIAAQLGGSAEALRKKLTRALDRVARELGLEAEP